MSLWTAAYPPHLLPALEACNKKKILGKVTDILHIYLQHLHKCYLGMSYVLGANGVMVREGMWVGEILNRC